MRLHPVGTFFYPPIFVQSSVVTYLAMNTLDSAGDGTQLVGNVIIDGFESGPKTLSAAGGGKIIIRTGATTWNNAASNLRVGIQNIDDSGSLIIGDGTYQVYADVAGGSGVLSNASEAAITMTNGSIDLSHGSFVSMVFECTARGGSDSTRLTAISADYTHTTGRLLPIVYENTGSGWTTKTTSALFVAYLRFDDGTLGWLLGCSPLVLSTSVSFNMNTGTADEYGNLIVLEQPMTVLGVFVFLNVSSGANFEVCVYADPLGSPSIVASKTVSSKYLRNSGSNYANILFDVPLQLPVGMYGVTIRPTTSNDITMTYITYRDVDLQYMIWCGANRAVRRLDNSGPFGYISPDSIFMLHLIGSHVGVPVGSAGYNLGV